MVACNSGLRIFKFTQNTAKISDFFKITDHRQANDNRCNQRWARDGTEMASWRPSPQFQFASPSRPLPISGCNSQKFHSTVMKLYDMTYVMMLVGMELMRFRQITYITDFEILDEWLWCLKNVPFLEKPTLSDISDSPWKIIIHEWNYSRRKIFRQNLTK